MKKNDCAILVLSCDKYADVWPTFYDFFFKYWPNCPFKIYHSSNFITYEHPAICNLNSKQVSDWSTETKSILEQIEEKYILTILEDYFIYQPVDTTLVLKSLEAMEKMNALFLKLACFPSFHNSRWKYEILNETPYLAKIFAHQDYRINLQIGIWNKILLSELLVQGESPWQFEFNGSKRSNQISNPCLCIVEDPDKDYVHGPITYLCTALSKGVWMRDAIRLCEKQNIRLNIGNRKVETQFEYFFRIIYTKTPLTKRKYLEFIKKKFFKFQY